MHIDTHPAVLATLPPKYQPLFDRVLDVTAADERIRAVWLSGSLARGVSDLGSDLDLVIAVRDEDFAEFGAQWRDWLAGITPTLIARQFGAEFTGFTSTTPDFCRLDVAAERVGAAAPRPRLVVFDRDGLEAQAPAPEDGAGPDRAAIERLAEEFLRVTSLFPVVAIARRDVLCSVEGFYLSRSLLYDLFVETNQPLPPMGAKQYSARLTGQQRDVLRALPPVAATPESVTTATLSILEAFRTAGRAAAEGAGATWPEELERAVTHHLAEEIAQAGTGG
ncbi:MAG TPA: aminoglycoside 6-adenylyltransferase [Mycobacteriales bacterium]|nr:aminoglycoside 6-adenylyltransferase [Mycobacteriales bacterium]